MQRLNHRIDRLKGTVHASLLEIPKPLGKAHINRGLLGWREHLIRIDLAFPFYDLSLYSCDIPFSTP